MKSTVKNLWAPIIKPKRGSEWINWTCIRLTRRDAKAAMCEHLPENLHAEWLKNVRFAKVAVSEMPLENARAVATAPSSSDLTRDVIAVATSPLFVGGRLPRKTPKP